MRNDPTIVAAMRLLVAAAVFATLSSAPLPAVAADRPNVIILLVDDLGWTDLGYSGSDLHETPHIDALSAQGVRFTAGYAACTVCSPTRASMLTGMYPARLHVTDFIAGHIRPNAKLKVPDWTMKLEHRHASLAEVLKSAGYATWHVGKWHLMPRKEPQDMNDYLPTRQGFDANIGGNEWGLPGSYFHPYSRGGRNARAVTNLPPGGKEGDYLTDRLTTEAIKLIDAHVANHKDKPFFLNFWYYNVHTPIQGRSDLVEKYKQKLADGKKRRHDNAAYAAMVESVDQSVGRLVAALKQRGVADNTLIIFTGDNGGLDRGNNPTDNAPLREGKGHVYEGGVRAPTFIVWPGVAKAGGVCDEPVITCDYYPTILEATGVKGDAKHNANVDGVSLLPLLKDPAATLKRDAIYCHYPHYHTGGATPYGAVRAGDYRLVEFYEDMRIELYNLADDVSEKNDLSKKMPEKAAELRRMLHTWREQVGAQMPARTRSVAGDVQ